MKIEVASRVGQVEEYYFSRKLREIADLRSRGIEVINLGIGSPDQMPAKLVIDELNHQSLKPDVHGYQSYIGIPGLRQSFVTWMQSRFGVELDAQGEVLPLIGSKEGIMHISMTYLEEGDEVLVPDPGYPTYRSASQLTGARVRTYDLHEKNKWWPDLAALEASDLSKVKLMWVNYPHMPTGALPPENGFAELVDFARRNEILLCHDNPYAFILNNTPRSMLSVPGAREVVLELHSLSKTFNMAGWRVGFLTGARERLKEVIRFKSNMDSGMFKPVQLAASRALQLEDDWYEKVNETYRSRRVVAADFLHELGCSFDQDQVGMFLWAKIPQQYSDGIEMADRVLDSARVFITPGNIFGEQGSQYIRVSLCSDVPVFEQAIENCRTLLV